MAWPQGYTVDANPSSPSVLLQHDGELSDIRRLLEGLGAGFIERLGPCEPRERTAGWDVIIASPRRILHFRPPAVGPKPTLISVLEGESRTLRSHLRRMRVDLIVCRPVHPAALRLLILHALYRGPERRRRERVTVGVDVRFRSGWLRQPATLTDLSLRGCRLLSRAPVVRGRPIKVFVPALAPLKKPLKLRGSVVRSGPAASLDPGIQVMAVRFGDLPARVAAQLQAVLDAHRGGPAVARGLDDDSSTDSDRCPARTPNAAEPDHVPAQVGRDCSEEMPATLDTEVGPAERRERHRRAYDKRVVALGDEATRVLLGRDISAGGMRVDPNPSLDVGDRLQLALHAGSRSEPMVVHAEVLRDDGDDGLVLRFEGDEDQDLDELIAHLPVSDGGGDENAGMLVSEIVEREAV
jgi:hypothetical protein